MNNVVRIYKMTDCILHVFSNMENVRLKVLFLFFMMITMKRVRACIHLLLASAMAR